jgi:nitrogen fixation protein NifB
MNHTNLEYYMPNRDTARTCTPGRNFVDLLVAPRVNALNRYADGGKPSVRSESLTPMQAASYLESVVTGDGAGFAIRIAGPGEPFADAEETMGLLEFIRTSWPGAQIWITSNGLCVAPHAARLAELGVTRFTLAMHAVDAQTAAAVYAWVRPATTTLSREEGFALLLADQAAALAALRENGIETAVEMLVVPGVNDRHVESVASTAAGAGASLICLVPFVPASGQDEDLAPAADGELMRTAREAASQHLPVGEIADPGGSAARNEELRPSQNAGAALLESLDTTRPCVAVATSDGQIVDMHLGQASTILVYGVEHGPIALVESRQAPPKGGGDERWKRLAEILGDCRALLVASAGAKPRDILGENGLLVMERSGSVEAALYPLFGMEPPRKRGKK